MSDLISRNALIQHAYSAVVDGVEKDIIDLSDVGNAPTVELDRLNHEIYVEGYDRGYETAKYLYTLPPDEKPQGKWIFHNDYHENCRYGCNQCGNLNNIPHNFCPNCGANMQKGGAE